MLFIIFSDYKSNILFENQEIIFKFFAINIKKPYTIEGIRLNKYMNNNNFLLSAL